jgi:hypothetical protein
MTFIIGSVFICLSKQYPNSKIVCINTTFKFLVISFDEQRIKRDKKSIANITFLKYSFHRWARGRGGGQRCWGGWGHKGFLPAVVAVVGRKATTHAMTTGGGRRPTHGVNIRPCWWGPQRDFCARGFSR